MGSDLSRPFDSISIIRLDREVWKLPVKIVNIWYEKDSPCRKHIEMVIMDSNVMLSVLFYSFPLIQ
jgi:hypothetical protein